MGGTREYSHTIRFETIYRHAGRIRIRNVYFFSIDTLLWISSCIDIYLALKNKCIQISILA